jgi:hypothetical protein
MFELLSAVVRLGGIREDFDEHYRVQQNVACIRFKLRLAADNGKVWIGVQPSRFNPKLQVARIDSAGLFLELLP